MSYEESLKQRVSEFYLSCMSLGAQNVLEIFQKILRSSLSNYCLSEYNQHIPDIPSNYISMQCRKKILNVF